MTDDDIRKGRKLLAIALLFAAFIIWGTIIVMSPHGSADSGEGGDYVKASIAIFARNGALGTLVLIAMAAALLFWRRKPRKEPFDIAVLAFMALLGASSFYQLVWIESDVLDVDVQGPIASEGT